MFCSLLLKKCLFFSKKDRLITTRFFWTVTVQERPKTRPANAYCPLGTIDFLKIVDIDNLLVENSKINSAFFNNQRVNLSKNGEVLTTEHSQRTLK